MSKWNVYCSENAPYRIYYRQIEVDEYEMYAMFPDRKSTRLNSSHTQKSRMPSSA